MSKGVAIDMEEEVKTDPAAGGCGRRSEDRSGCGRIELTERRRRSMGSFE